MDFKEALKIAEERNIVFGRCSEYTDCFVFPPEEYSLVSPFVVMKKDGAVLNYVDYLGTEEHSTSQLIKFYCLEDGKWMEKEDV